MEVAEGSNYLTFGEWEVELDSTNNSFSLREQEEDRRNMVQQGNNPNDVLILNMIRSYWDFPTNKEIEDTTGLPHSTTQGRLTILEKRDEVVKIKDKPIRWMANPNIYGLSMSNGVDK